MVSALAASIAASSASTSSTYEPDVVQSTDCTCQPYASYRAATSSLNETSVSSSMEMWFLS